MQNSVHKSHCLPARVRFAAVLALFLPTVVAATPASAQRERGELQIEVHDPQGQTVTAQGFTPWTGLLEVRSEVPVRVAVVLGVAPVDMKIEVTDAATILDPSE